MRFNYTRKKWPTYYWKDCVIAHVQRSTTVHLTLVWMAAAARPIPALAIHAPVWPATMELTAARVSVYTPSIKYSAKS